MTSSLTSLAEESLKVVRRANSKKQSELGGSVTLVLGIFAQNDGHLVLSIRTHTIQLKVVEAQNTFRAACPYRVPRSSVKQILS